MTKGTIYISGIIGEDTTLLDVIRQFKSFDNPTEVEVHIDSVGGSVDAGMSIYNYLRKLNLPVTTIATKAYSIAASIFMAGNTRKVLEGKDRIMIHFPWAEVSGGSDVLEGVAKELKTIEKDFINFYSKYTSIDEDAISALLQNETFLSADEAFELGFATEMLIPLAAVALYNSSLFDETKTQENKMDNKEKTFINALRNFFKSTIELKALMVQDANGVEINFPDLSDDDEIIVGSIAEVDGNPAQGEYTAVNGDVWVFEAGELMEIRINEDEVVEEAPVEEEVAVAEDVVAEETEDVEDFNVEEIISELTNSITEKVKAELSEENETLRVEILGLKKLVGSEDAEVSPTNTKNNTNNLSELSSPIKGLMKLRSK